MSTVYFEMRKQGTKGADSLMADMMRHLHTRQHLGKVVVVCDSPNGMLSSARKQWLRLSRTLQNQRARTLNAERILKYTHSITTMQHLQFSKKPPLEDSGSDIFFVDPSQLHALPIHCFSLYITTSLGSETHARALLDQLPSDALVVDYAGKTNWQTLGLLPKKMLEQQVSNTWRQVQQYLAGYNIKIENFESGGIRNVEAIDDALDTLLGVSHQFLQVATSFQHALEIARPLHLTKDSREHYDSFILLAHRVQTLSYNTFAKHFLEVYNNEDDLFLLHDPARGRHAWAADTLAEALTYHAAAGRSNLVRALSTRLLGRHSSAVLLSSSQKSGGLRALF